MTIYKGVVPCIYLSALHLTLAPLMALILDLLMPTKCNALAVRDAISLVIPTHSIFSSFLFPSFSIISLHSVAAQPAVFAKIRRLGGWAAHWRD